MAQYILKDAVMSVIDKKLSFYKDLESRGLLSKEGDAAFRAVRILKSDINFLEVKGVDLEKEIDKWYDNEASKEFENVLYEDIEKCAKHFFELGMNTSKGKQ